jgi:hypothetical protein
MPASARCRARRRPSQVSSRTRLARSCKHMLLHLSRFAWHGDARTKRTLFATIPSTDIRTHTNFRQPDSTYPYTHIFSNRTGVGNPRNSLFEASSLDSSYLHHATPHFKPPLLLHHSVLSSPLSTIIPHICCIKRALHRSIASLKKFPQPVHHQQPRYLFGHHLEHQPRLA